MNNLIFTGKHVIRHDEGRYTYYKITDSQYGHNITKNPLFPCDKVLIRVSKRGKDEYFMCNCAGLEKWIDTKLSTHLEQMHHVYVSYLKQISYEEYEKENK